MADALTIQRQALFVSRTEKAVAPTAGPVILFTAGGSRFAVEANQVEEIRDREDRTAIRRTRGPELIDFAWYVGLGAGSLERLVILKPGECALGVTGVERMTTLPRAVPLPAMFCGAERQWYRGLLLLEDEVVPLIRAEFWRQPAQFASSAGNACSGYAGADNTSAGGATNGNASSGGASIGSAHE
jgi:hypothetical protein